MGALGRVFGIGGSADRPGPENARIVDATNPQQIGGIYTQNMKALEGQKALLAALQGQGGIQNQSQVYNQLQGIASGNVNPAQAQFNQNTAANVANQAALMAGQRGASSNVGLMARNAALQGGAIQQNAAGQAAIQQAQNQINAIQAAGSLATQQAGQQIGAQNALTSATQAEQQNLLNALAQMNSAKVSSQGSVNAANAGLQQAQTQAAGGIFGGLANAAGAGLSSLIGSGSGGGGAIGGAVPTASGLASGGANDVAGSFTYKPSFASGGAVGPQSSIGKRLSGFQPHAGGGMVDVVVSPGEKIASPGAAERIAQGGSAQLRTVPGKANVGGDSLKNDTVPMKLPAGSVVVKRTRANDDPEGFIREVLSKRKGRK